MTQRKRLGMDAEPFKSGVAQFQKRGGTFYFLGKQAGKWVTLHSCPLGQEGTQEAREAVLKRLRLMEGGLTPDGKQAPEKAPERRKAGATLGDLVTRFKQSNAFLGRKPKTRSEYARSLDAVRERFGDVPVREFVPTSEHQTVTPEVINSWLDEVEDNRSSRRADKDATALGIVLNWSKDVAQVIPAHCFNQKVCPRRHNRNRQHIIWQPQHIEALRPHVSKEMMWVVDLARFTGLRQMDLLNLKWSQIGPRDLSGVRKLRVKTQKTGEWITPPLLDEAEAVLAEVEAENVGREEVLTSPTFRRWYPDHFRKLFRRACYKAGLSVARAGSAEAARKGRDGKPVYPGLLFDADEVDTGLVFHDLRGTAVTWLAEGGLNFEEIAMFTGHTRAHVNTILELYAKRTDARHANIVTKMRRARGDNVVQLQQAAG